MQILHVLDSIDPRYGGPVRAVVDLSERAREHGIESHYAAFAPMVPKHPVPYTHIFKTEWPSSYRYCRDFVPWLHKNLSRFDGVVLHSLWLYWGWAASRECARLRVPYACFPHGMLEPWPVRGQGWKKRIKKELYWKWRESKVIAGARCLLFTTSRELHLAKRTFRLPQIPMFVVPYGSSTSTRPVGSKPEGLQHLEGRKYVLFFGRLHPKKNPELLIRAWAQAAPKDWLLILAGPSEPKYRERLKKLVTQFEMNNRVQFLDFVDGARKAWLLTNASWFVLPSSQENFAVAVLEAIQHGCPAAVSDQVAIAEKLPAQTPKLRTILEDWVTFFREQASDENFRTQIRDAQARLAREHFNMETLAHGWSDALLRAFGLERPQNVQSATVTSRIT